MEEGFILAIPWWREHVAGPPHVLTGVRTESRTPDRKQNSALNLKAVPRDPLSPAILHDLSKQSQRRPSVYTHEPAGNVLHPNCSGVQRGIPLQSSVLSPALLPTPIVSEFVWRGPV